jgi:hypothetical protein
MQRVFLGAICALVLFVPGIQAADSKATPLYNGKDLTGWRGQGMHDPAVWNAMSSEEREKKQTPYNDDLKKHWRAEGEEIINDGKGVYLTTDKDYGDFILELEWKMMAPGGDSGIYLRGYPQVQIWDPANEKEKKNGADKGSGALWNNSDPKNGKFPLVVADKPIGEWNKVRIEMRGEVVTITMNDKLVVDKATLDNYYKRGTPISPVGPIQLQTHGSEMRFRNITIQELK